MNVYSTSKLLKMGGNNIGYTYRFILSTIKMLMVYSLHVALWPYTMETIGMHFLMCVQCPQKMSMCIDG